jgi:hypothetical protein
LVFVFVAIIFEVSKSKYMLAQQLIQSHQGAGYSSKTKTTIYQKDEYTIIEIESRSFQEEITKITFRNCSRLNPESALQFTYEKWFPNSNKKTIHASFSLPSALIDTFINQLKKEN